MNYIDCLNVNGTLYDIATRVHPDWCQSDTDCYDYICNKPDKVSCFDNDLCYARHCELCNVARTAEYCDVCNTPVVQTQVIACQCPVSANAVKVCVDSICQCTTALTTCINNMCTCLDNRITAVCDEMICLHEQSLAEINLLWQDSTARAEEIQIMQGCDTRLQDGVNCNADCITAIKTCLYGLDNVAFSGLYCDLSGQPTCVSQFINDAAYIDKDANNLTYYYDQTCINTMFNGLADVANSGLYCDLNGTPDLSVYALSACLCPVATSGSYNCLTNKLTAGTGICITAANVICAVGGSGATYYCFTGVNMDSCIAACASNSNITVFCFVNSTGGGTTYSGDNTCNWVVTMFNANNGIAYGSDGQVFNINNYSWAYANSEIHLITCTCAIQRTLDAWNSMCSCFPLSGIATIIFDNPTASNLLLCINEDVTNTTSVVLLNKNSYTNVTIPVVACYAYEFAINCDAPVAIERYTIMQ